MKHVLFHSLSNPLQPRRCIGVAIGEYVLDVSAVAPLFFTGPTLGPQQQVRHMAGKVKVSGQYSQSEPVFGYLHNSGGGVEGTLNDHGAGVHPSIFGMMCIFRFSRSLH